MPLTEPEDRGGRMGLGEEEHGGLGQLMRCTADFHMEMPTTRELAHSFESPQSHLCWRGTPRTPATMCGLTPESEWRRKGAGR